MKSRALILILLGLVLCPIGVARGEIYSYTDKDGVLHFTNLAPAQGKKNKWKKVMGEAANVGKASVPRGECPRCDKVSSRDRSPERFHRYDEFIAEASALYAMPEPLIRAVIKIESDYDPRVVSAMDAKGLMQLMPDVMVDMGVSDAHDPRQNILGGTRLLRILANRYDGDLVRTIAAYHAGMGSLARYGNNVPPYEKTRQYLKMVLGAYYKYRDAQASL